MLSIGNLLAAPGVGQYYLEQVAGGREDYYAGEGEDAGYWARRRVPMRSASAVASMTVD